MDGTVLIADDDHTIRTVLSQAFTRAGCKVHATASLMTLIRWVKEGKGDLVVSDVMMPDGNGLDVVPQINQMRDDLPVIIISAQNTIMTAIKANEVNVFQYLPKPFDLPELMKKSAQALAIRRRVEPSKTSNRPDEPSFPIIGKTAKMQDIYRRLAPLLNVDVAVLIQGENGTGKSLIAQAIHDLSDRGTRSLVVLNADMARREPAIMDAFDKARGGTLVLDEIADFDLTVQAKLVRILDSGDGGQDLPRFVATSQKSLAQSLQKGEFRSDLYYRIAGIMIDIPPLRDRLDDLEFLVAHFMGKNQSAAGGGGAGISDEALQLMRRYAWPGNVRQCENFVQQLCLMNTEGEIDQAEVAALMKMQPMSDNSAVEAEMEHLGKAVDRNVRQYFNLHENALPQAGVYHRILREVELPLIQIALEATGGNQAKCADLLGINRNTLRKKITELNIEVTRKRKLL